MQSSSSSPQRQTTTIITSFTSSTFPNRSTSPRSPTARYTDNDDEKLPTPPPTSSPSHSHSRSISHSHSYSRPRGLRISNLIRQWMPILLYIFVSLAFVVAFAMYKTEMFAMLDELATWLRADEQFGYAVLFCMIFLTTIPPIPLYSTLIVLSGYTFGAWRGAVVSYFAGLAGALFVFILSRSLLRHTISRWLNGCESMKRVVGAIEKRPTLLFLIRLAPYPYNVMNCLLAAAPTLTLKTYTICTALSLFKVIVHTGLGASIHSFKDYQQHSSSDNEAMRYWTIGGIVLCIAILVYLSVVARRAVEEELVEGAEGDAEERVGFLSACQQDEEQDMVESPLVHSRPSISV